MTEKGKKVLDIINQYFPNNSFTLKELNQKSTEEIFSATLTTLVNNSILTKLNTKPTTYKLSENNIKEKNKIMDSIPMMPINNNININLLHGDSQILLKSIADNSIDCVITDPPYFIDGMGNDWQVDKLKEKANRAGVVQSMPVGMKFDPKQGIELQKFMEIISKEVYRILKPGGFYLAFSQARLYHRMAMALENCNFEIRDMIVWKREGQAKAFSQDHFIKKMNISEEEKEKIITSLDGRKTPQLKPQIEPIVLAQKPKEGTFVQNWMKYKIGLIDVNQSLDGLFPGNVMEVPKEKSSIAHFTVKPIRLIEHLIKIFSPEGATICDPFLGSGTTGIACIHTNRNFIGIELNDEYFALAKERIEKENGTN